jgi:DMSO/TMAO reductase YedYZ molybdopterin-dependent catalytic subunit
MVTRFAGRTVNGIPRQARALAANPLLRLDGLVEHALALTPADILALPHEPYLGKLSCIEKGNVPLTDWSGVRLSDVIALAKPHADARFVRVSAGPYGVPVALERADQVLLCDALSGEPLGVEQGGPWRLVIPDRTYFTSVKWVDRIELTTEEPDDSASRIAVARERARNAKRR